MGLPAIYSCGTRVGQVLDINAIQVATERPFGEFGVTDAQAPL